MTKNLYYFASIAASIIGLLLALAGITMPGATAIDITITCSIPFAAAIGCYLIGESK